MSTPSSPLPVAAVAEAQPAAAGPVAVAASSASASASSKGYSSATKSRIDELYASKADIVGKRPVVQLFDKRISIRDLLTRIISQPFVATRPKSGIIDVDRDIGAESIAAFHKALKKIPTSNMSAVAEFICVESLPQVRFLEGSIMPGSGKYMQPRMVIDMTGVEVPANSGVRINTGYIVRIPQIAMGKRISDGRIINTTQSKQIGIIVLPIIVSQCAGLVPTVYARDPEDTGLLTINFTTTASFVPNSLGKLQVVFMAFSMQSLIDAANVLDAEPDGAAAASSSASSSEGSSIDLFKAKDSNNGRLVKNPKVKFLANSFDTASKPNHCLVSTFSTTKSTVDVHAKQKIQFNTDTLFSSRKREWCDPNVVSLSGVFFRSKALRPFTCAPITCANSTFAKNTHCVSFIEQKVTLFSANGRMMDDLRILNGAFADYPDYANVSGYLRQLFYCIQALYLGASVCDDIAKAMPELPFEGLLRFYDYNRTISQSDPTLRQKIALGDEEMFNSRGGTKNAYSVLIYRAMRNLARVFCADLFTAEQLEELRLMGSGAAGPSEQGLPAATSGAIESPAGEAADGKRRRSSDGESLGVNGEDGASAKRSKLEVEAPAADALS